MNNLDNKHFTGNFTEEEEKKNSTQSNANQKISTLNTASKEIKIEMTSVSPQNVEKTAPVQQSTTVDNDEQKQFKKPVMNIDLKKSNSFGKQRRVSTPQQRCSVVSHFFLTVFFFFYVMQRHNIATTA
jgi:hypothetical protein